MNEIKIKGGYSPRIAEVNADDNLNINISSALTNSGYIIFSAEVDDGSILGEKTIRPIEPSQDYRLRVGIDKIVWQDTFNHSTLNTSKYLSFFSGQTISLSGDGFLTLNHTGSTANNDSCSIRTYRTFSLYNTYSLYADMQAYFTNSLQSNNVIELGFGLGTATTVSSEGIFFRASGGTLYGVRTYDTTGETSTNLNFAPTPNVSNHYLIVSSLRQVEFWIDDVLYGVIENSYYSGYSNSTRSNSLPFFARSYNTAITPGVTKLRIGQIGISQGDMITDKRWEHAMSTNGQSSISAPDGQIATQTANYLNSAAPNSLIPNQDFSNTIAGYSTLGGQFCFSGTTGSETDYVLFGYQNPIASATIPGKTLLISGIKIETYITGASVSALMLSLLQWSIAVGSTSVSLATTDSAVSGTRGPRILPLGVQSFITGATYGTAASKELTIDFLTPLMIESGTFCNIVVKMPIMSATTNCFYKGTCEINGYFE